MHCRNYSRQAQSPMQFEVCCFHVSSGSEVIEFMPLTSRCTVKQVLFFCRAFQVTSYLQISYSGLTKRFAFIGVKKFRAFINWDSNEDRNLFCFQAQKLHKKLFIKKKKQLTLSCPAVLLTQDALVI